MAAMWCARCAEERPAGHAFCEVCGGVLHVTSTAAPATDFAPAPQLPPTAAPVEPPAPILPPPPPPPTTAILAPAQAGMDTPGTGTATGRRRTVLTAIGAAVAAAAVASVTTVAVADARQSGSHGERAGAAGTAARPTPTAQPEASRAPASPSSDAAQVPGAQPSSADPVPATSAPLVTGSAEAGPVGDFAVDMMYVQGSCEAPPATDAANNPVNYAVTNATDGDPATAWRCPGLAQNQYLTFVLGKDHTLPVSDVGIIPGYAKTDPYSGANRFTENHTVTRVRWEFDDGAHVTRFEQVIDDPQPVMTWAHLPVPVNAVTGRVVIEQASNPNCAFDFTAVSEVALRGPSPERQ